MIVAKSTFRWSDDTAEAGDATLVAYCYRLALSAKCIMPRCGTAKDSEAVNLTMEDYLGRFHSALAVQHAVVLRSFTQWLAPARG
jgi:hypothetical protein